MDALLPLPVILCRARVCVVSFTSDDVVTWVHDTLVSMLLPLASTLSNESAVGNVAWALVPGSGVLFSELVMAHSPLSDTLCSFGIDGSTFLIRTSPLSGSLSIECTFFPFVVFKPLRKCGLCWGASKTPSSRVGCQGSRRCPPAIQTRGEVFLCRWPPGTAPDPAPLSSVDVTACLW